MNTNLLLILAQIAKTVTELYNQLFQMQCLLLIHRDRKRKLILMAIDAHNAQMEQQKRRKVREVWAIKRTSSIGFQMERECTGIAFSLCTCRMDS